MEIRGNLGSNPVGGNVDGLTSILGTSQTSSTALYGVSNSSSGSGEEDAGLEGDWATVSAAGNKIAQAVSDTSVRENKVSSIRSALAAGTYSVPAQSVASRAVGAMLAGQI